MTISPKFPHVSSLNPNAAAPTGSDHGSPSHPRRITLGGTSPSGFLTRERDLLVPQQPAAMPDGVGVMVRYDALAQTTHVAASETVVLASIGAATGICLYALYLASQRRNVN